MSAMRTQASMEKAEKFSALSATTNSGLRHC